MTVARQDAPKPWKGLGMEGGIARWYARTRSNDMPDFRRQAQAVAARLHRGSDVLEVAPGPGFFSVELARLGEFHITGLDISCTFVEIASENARNANVKVDFRHGSASAMPFADESFDMVYCSAAFKNFTEPVKALNEMHRVLRPGGEAVIVDLRKDASIKEINAYVDQSRRKAFDKWTTKWTFRMLLKRAYTQQDFKRMAQQSPFGQCTITANGIGFEVRFAKPAQTAARV